MFNFYFLFELWSVGGVWGVGMVGVFVVCFWWCGIFIGGVGLLWVGGVCIWVCEFWFCVVGCWFRFCCWVWLWLLFGVCWVGVVIFCWFWMLVCKCVLWMFGLWYILRLVVFMYDVFILLFEYFLSLYVKLGFSLMIW